jgi:hypothetical protein
MSRIHQLSRLIGKFTGKVQSGLLCTVCCVLVAGWLSARPSRLDSTVLAKPEGEARPALQGEKAIEHLKEQGTYQSLAEAMAAVKYQANWQPRPQLENLGAAYELKNAANNLLAYVNGDGLQVTSLSDAKKSWRLGLQLKAYGYGNNLMAISAGEVTAKETRVEIKRNASRITHHSQNGTSTARAASNTGLP